VTDYPRNPASALSTAVARSVEQCYADVVMLVERAPGMDMTETQKTQLRVVLGMYGRAIAAQGRWYERQRHNLGVATTTISPRMVLRETQPHQSASGPLPSPPATTTEDPKYPDDAPTQPMPKRAKPHG
jgi:hypothetical protein